MMATAIGSAARSEDSAASAPEPRVTQVVIEGANELETDFLERELALEPPLAADTTLVSRAIDRLLAVYQGKGFLRAEVSGGLSPREGTDFELRLMVREGQRARLDTLVLEGCRGIPPVRVRQELALRAGDEVKESLIQADTERILRLYEEEGYPFARVILKDARLTAEGDGLTLTMSVEEGSRARLEGIRVQGNAFTKDSYIRREMMLHPGEIYRQSRINRGMERLARTELFDRVDMLGLRPKGSARRVILELEVREGPPNSLEAAAGYVPGGLTGGDGYLTGRVDLRLGNIGGVARSAEIHWRSFAPGSSSWRLAYREPWVFSLPLALAGDIHQEVRDSTYTTRGFGVEMVFPLSYSLELELAGLRERTTTSTRGFGVGEESRLHELAAGLRFDRRDRRLNPRRGGYVSMRGGLSRRRVTGRDGVDQEESEPTEEILREDRLEVGGGLFLTDGSDRVLAMEADFRQRRSSGDEVPFYQLYFIGGAAGPRGYAEDQFAGSRVVRGALEQRFLLGPRSRFHFFLDVGYDKWREEGNWHLGYGAGLRLATRLGMVGVDLGLAVGESLSDGMVHVRLTEEW